MVEKKYTPKRTYCKVTFRVPVEWAQEEASVVGDFNNWDQSAHKLIKNHDSWETTVRLRSGNEVRFRYFLDNKKWQNDDQADGYVPNGYGSEDCLIRLEN